MKRAWQVRRGTEPAKTGSRALAVVAHPRHQVLEGRAAVGRELVTCVPQVVNSDPLGLVWIALDRPRAGHAWIYDIEINSEHRGKGYGRALLQATEQESVRHGAKSLSLNVFGTNTVARGLYETSGYEIAAAIMRKDLH